MRSPRSLRSALLVAFALAVAVALVACDGDGGAGDGAGGDGTAIPAEATATAVPVASVEDPPTEEPLTGLIAISSGRSATCALQADGSPVCWGGASGEWSLPEGKFIDVSVRGGFEFEETVVCGLREEGEVVCWGDEAFGSVSAPEGERFTAISGTCGIRQSDGSVVCWGADGQYEVALSPDDYGENRRFVAISGQSRACALLDNGEATCARNVGDERFASVSAGGRLSCGLRKEDGLPVCWDSPHILERHPPPEGERFAAVSSSPYLEFVCALRPDGSAACWGYDMYIGATLPPANERFSAISAGDYHVCAIRVADGSPSCWGAGQPTLDLGQASPPGGDRPQPRLPEDGRFIAISAGYFYVCALRPDGAPVCAGRGDFGGGGPPSDERLTAVSVGASHTCGLRRDGSPICWSNVGQLDSEPNPSIWGAVRGGEPLDVSWPEGEAFTAVSSGDAHTCALREDGTPICRLTYTFGDDGYDVGLLDPPAGETFSSISSGSWYTCGLRADGSPLCWAAFEEDVGELPELGPPEEERFTVISSGGGHACALREDGTAACWTMTEFADDDVRDAYDVGQTDPPEGETFTAISVGSEHTCAIRTNGSLVCWGDNFTESALETLREEDRFIAVSAGFHRVCALRVDGSPVCWGI